MTHARVCSECDERLCVVCGVLATSSVEISASHPYELLVDVGPDLSVQHYFCRRHLSEWSYRIGRVVGEMITTVAERRLCATAEGERSKR